MQQKPNSLEAFKVHLVDLEDRSPIAEIIRRHGNSRRPPSLNGDVHVPR